MKSKSEMTQVFVRSVVPVVIILMLSLLTGGAQAATFVVNSTVDVVDAAPGNGACATAECICTVRAAIQEANALSGADTIVFDPSAFSVPKTITLGSALPAIAQDLTITGPGANVLTVDANQTGSVFRIASGVSTTTMSDLTMTGGKAGASSGGGIHSQATLLTLTNVTIRGNTANYGGGIFQSGTIVINNCTISGNTAVAGGGGIINYINGTLTLNNSTVSGNSAGFGGGIAASNYGNTLILNNSTVSGNTGEGLNQQAGAVIMKNTILANNGGGNCRFQVQSQNSGALISRGHNLSTDIHCTPNYIRKPNVSGGLDHPSDRNDTLAHLAPLTLNAPGSTRTHALCTGAGAPDPSCVTASVAIDAVPSTDCTDTAGNRIASDQRGVSRPETPGGPCDIGAYEVAKAVVSPNHPPVANAGPDQTIAATSRAGAAVTLDGFASSDPDGDPFTYTWTGSFGTVEGVSPTVNLPLETNTVTLTVSDAQATAMDTVNITVHDATPPDTIISSAVERNGAAVANGGSTLSDYIAFTFGGIDAVGVAGFQCSLDGAAYAPCSSVAGYSALAIGSHIFQVQALDAAGNADPSPGSFICTVVTTAQAIENLSATISKMGLLGGVANSLSASLGQASTLLNDNNPGNDIAVCGKLDAFNDKVNARFQNGQLTPAQASQLLHDANAIKASLSC